MKIKPEPTNIKLRIKNLIEEKDIWKYPLFISYPRSGSHWLNVIMELYFNRPRLRKSRVTILDKSRKDWMWIHDHDWYLRIIDKLEKGKIHPHGKILYLYRNSLDVEKSYKKLRKNLYGMETVSEDILEHVTRHQKKYLDKPYVVAIQYENFKNKNKRANEFKKICEFFNKPFNKQKIEKLFKKYEGVKFGP